MLFKNIKTNHQNNDNLLQPAMPVTNGKPKPLNMTPMINEENLFYNNVGENKIHHPNENENELSPSFLSSFHNIPRDYLQQIEQDEQKSQKSQKSTHIKNKYKEDTGKNNNTSLKLKNNKYILQSITVGKMYDHNENIKSINLLYNVKENIRRIDFKNLTFHSPILIPNSVIAEFEIKLIYLKIENESQQVQKIGGEINGENVSDDVGTATFKLVCWPTTTDNNSKNNFNCKFTEPKSVVQSKLSKLSTNHKTNSICNNIYLEAEIFPNISTNNNLLKIFPNTNIDVTQFRKYSEVLLNNLYYLQLKVGYNDDHNENHNSYYSHTHRLNLIDDIKKMNLENNQNNNKNNNDSFYWKATIKSTFQEL